MPNNTQRRFFGKLFKKQKTVPVSERISLVRNKTKRELNSLNEQIKATKQYIELNERSEGSHSLMLDRQDLQKAVSRAQILQKRLKRISEIELKSKN
jgi:hypothetical protein